MCRFAIIVEQVQYNMEEIWKNIADRRHITDPESLKLDYARL